MSTATDTTTARAIVVTARHQAELQAIEVPAVPAAGQLCGPTACTLMSPGTELAWYYSGEHVPGQPGYAAVFRVEAIGAEVDGWAIGDLAFCMGGHRSRQCVAADGAVKLPAGLAPDHAVLARLMGVSMTTLMTTTARPGDTVLVTGAGPVGFLAAQQFRHAGYDVHVVEPDPARRAHLDRLGLPAYDSVPTDSLTGRVALVLECSGHEGATLAAIDTVRRRGEVVLVGVPWTRRTELTAHDLLDRVFHRYAVLRSCWEWELAQHPSPQSPHSIFGNVRLALDWLAAGHIQVDGLFAHHDPAAAQAAYQDHLHHRVPALFSIFDWQG